MQKLWLTCILFLLQIALLQAQPATTGTGHVKRDSILSLLKNGKKDTVAVKLLREAGISILYENPADAIPYFREGSALAKALKFYPGLESCFASLSLAQSLLARYDSALLYIDSAIHYVRFTKDKERVALCYLNKADVLTNMQDLSAALVYCDSAMLFAEAGGYTAGKARIYSVMSDIYAVQGNYTKAFEELDRSLVLFKATDNAQMVGMTHFSRASFLQDQQQLEAAIPYYRKAIYIADSIRDYSNISAYTGGLAQTYAMLERYADAEAMIQRSLDIALQLKNRKQEAIAYDFFFNVALLQKQYVKAIQYESKAYAIMQEEKDLGREQAMASNLATGYEAAGQFADAYKYLVVSQQLKDSLLKLQFNDETARLQTKYEVSEKNKAIELLNKDQEIQRQKIRQQKIITGGVAAIAAFALITILVVINRNKLRQKMRELELRNRIAADLHDEVGSSLSSIHMLSEMAATQSADENSLMTRISINARETMEKMSDLVWMIKPTAEDQHGLIQRVERFAYDVSNSRNIEIALDLEKLQTTKLTPEQSKSVYLIIKEAVNNAAKYANPAIINISAQIEGKLLRLTVADNGKGFEPASVIRGQGLHNMQQRATDMQGSLSVASHPGEGCQVILTFPLS